MRRIGLSTATIPRRDEPLGAGNQPGKAGENPPSWGMRRSGTLSRGGQTHGRAAEVAGPLDPMDGSSVTGGTGARSVNVIFSGSRRFGGLPTVSQWLTVRGRQDTYRARRCGSVQPTDAPKAELALASASTAAGRVLVAVRYGVWKDAAWNKRALRIEDSPTGSH
jgi:hypothetical protein